MSHVTWCVFLRLCVCQINGQEAGSRVNLLWPAIIPKVSKREWCWSLASHTEAPHQQRCTNTKLLPPACLSELSVDDPWWSLKSDLSISHLKDHFICRFSNNCTWVPTNFQRVSSLRNLMRVTDEFLTSFNVTYTIASGTAIGAHRCSDTLPWDADVDVLVPDEFFPKLATLLSSAPNQTYSMGNGDSIIGRSVDMASIGFKGFELMEKIAGCLPLAIIDQSTGLYTDILTGKSAGSGFLSPWSQGRVSCDSQKLFNGCINQHFSHKCHNFSIGDLQPARRCKFHTFEVMCPSRIWPFLVEEFGPGVAHSDIEIRCDDPEIIEL